MATLHTSANKGDVAKVVIFPGDPVRATYIAEHFLTDVKVVSDVRGIKIYTGYYQNKRISVTASGMGQPSLAIYAYELFKELDVEFIIRVGTTGALQNYIHVNDILVAASTATDSNFAYQYDKQRIYMMGIDNDVMDIVRKNTQNNQNNVHFGTIFTNDAFYGETIEFLQTLKDRGVLSIEMECFALYYIAHRLNKKALGLLKASNHFFNDEPPLNNEQKVKTMDEIMSLALSIAVDYINNN